MSSPAMPLSAHLCQVTARTQYTLHVCHYTDSQEDFGGGSYHSHWVVQKEELTTQNPWLANGRAQTGGGHCEGHIHIL
jgi:hypothetical protein